MARKVSSKRVARIAGKMMRNAEALIDCGQGGHRFCVGYRDFVVVEWKDVVALAASVLSQTEPKKRKARK